MYQVLAVILIMLLTGVACAPPALAQDSDLPLTRIPYVPDGTRRQTLDVALPNDTTEAPPVVLLFHGADATALQMVAQKRHIVEAGYAAVVVDYRESSAPAEAVSDALCALAWTVANAEAYGWDTERMAALGYSRGGYLASMLAVLDHPNDYLMECPHRLPDGFRIRGAVTYAAPYYTGAAWVDLLSAAPEETKAALRRLAEMPPRLWAAVSSIPAELAAFLPYTQPYSLDADDPPFVIIHSADDHVVPVVSAQSFAALLAEYTVPHTLFVLPDGGHQFRLFVRDHLPEVNTAVDAFLTDIFAEDALN